MATRNLTMVVDRKHAEKYKEGFAANPSNFTDNSYVNMYLHHDGYPEWQGIQIANWLHANPSSDGSRLAAKLVHDMYYDSCYLYPTPELLTTITLILYGQVKKTDGLAVGITTVVTMYLC